MDKDLSPRVTVLMPVFNGGPFLREAIQSILDQNYQDFELLIFNDGSTDNSSVTINSFADKRITGYHYEKNIGYVSRLNYGISIAKGEYIARMDADDVSLPSRLKTQVEFMDAFSEVGICGTSIEIIDELGLSLGNGQRYIEDEMLRIKLLADACFAHPTVIIRKSILVTNNLWYNENFAPAEDYKLWFDVSLKSDLANLPEVLLKYRIHSQQITRRKREIQKKATDAIRKLVIQDFLGHTIEENDFVLHNTLFTNDYILSKSYVIEARQWLRDLIKHNQTGKQFDEKLFKKYIGETWFSLCTHSYKLGLWIVFVCFSSQFRLSSIPPRNVLKFVAKSVIKFSPITK